MHDHVFQYHLARCTTITGNIVSMQGFVMFVHAREAQQQHCCQKLSSMHQLIQPHLETVTT